MATARSKKNSAGIIFIIALASFSQLSAQPALPRIDVATITLSDTIYYRSSCTEDAKREVTPEKAAVNPFTLPGRALFRHLTATQTAAGWWIAFRLTNSADSLIKIYFFPGVYAAEIDIYAADSATGHLQLLPAGLPPIPDSIGYRGISIPPAANRTYYAHLRFVHTNVNAMDLRLIRDYYVSSFSRTIKMPLNNGYMYTYIITGILLLMIFYSLAVFMLNGTVEFMYYACFAFFTGLLFFLKSYYLKSMLPFNYLFESYLDFVIQSLGVFFYYIFLRRFLDTRNNFIFLHRLFIFGQITVLVSLPVFTWLNFLTVNYALQDSVESITKMLWISTTVIFLVYAIFRKNRMLNILAAGHFFLLVFSILSLVMISYPGLIRTKGPSIWRDSLFNYELGMTLELIFFLMALAFKNRDDIIDRTRERERLVLENERKEFEKQLAVVEAKQDERNRISTDMHDELGSGVTAIRLMSEIVKTKMKGSALPEIDKISSNANDLLSKMNTIIWTMSSSNDRLDNMIAYTRSFAFEFLENTTVACHFTTPETIPPVEVSGEKRRNIFLCVKESLNNMVKYAKANDVWINFTILPGSLEITIQDNGVGINLEKLREFGNGLNNMKKRIESMSGNFSIRNHQGTHTRIIVPL